MSFSSLGDMAQAFALRHQNTSLRNTIQRLNQEVATGQAADLADHLGGSYARLTDLERDMRLLKSFEVNITEASQFADAMQMRLQQISDISTDFSGDLIAASASGETATSDAISAEARLHFGTIVDALNSQSAGRTMFAGDATDSAALVGADDILAELNNVLVGATDYVDVTSRIELWFNDPAGFDAFAYTGSDTSLSSFKMSETTAVGIDVRANDPAIKDVLKSLSKSIIATDPALSLSVDDQRLLVKESAEGLLTAQEDLIGAQAKLGLAQEQVSSWLVRTQTERIGMEYAKGALVAVDPYETATSLEAAQFQLESLYTVTVRLSQLSLVNFLR